MQSGLNIGIECSSVTDKDSVFSEGFLFEFEVSLALSQFCQLIFFALAHETIYFRLYSESSFPQFQMQILLNQSNCAIKRKLASMKCQSSDPLVCVCVSVWWISAVERSPSVRLSVRTERGKEQEPDA